MEEIQQNKTKKQIIHNNQSKFRRNNKSIIVQYKSI